MFKYDLLFRGGRIVDPANGREFLGDIAISGNIIERVDEQIDESLAKQVVDVTGKIVMPGIIDTHAHAYKPGINGVGYKMLIKAGVTTVIDFQGPIESIVKEIKHYGCGINIATLQGIYPGQGIDKNNASKVEVENAINLALEHGAIGMKIIGGHYPLTPETTYNIIHLTNSKLGYVGFHVGTTETGSNILGLEEAVNLAEGKPLHVAHINAYCRGLIEEPLLELNKTIKLLESSPNVVSESHLAPYNGCDGRIEADGLPRSHVTRNCLRAKDYELSRLGLEMALEDGYAGVYSLVGNELKYIFGKKAVEYWLEAGTNVGICFPVNIRQSALTCAIEKKNNEDFVVDAISSDGGAIPRNFILSLGIALVKFGGLTLSEFVKKVSWTPAKMIGLEKKGHLSVGADADIIIINPENSDVEIVLSSGKIAMASGVVTNLPGKIITTERGINYLRQFGVSYEVVDLAKSLYFKGKGVDKKN